VPQTAKLFYFSRGDGTCAGHLAKVAADGGPESALRGSGLRGPEQWPAVRPTGTQIAFARYDCATHQRAWFWSVLVLAPVIGEVRNELLTLRSGVDLVSMSFDASGQFLLYATT
jgi:hypothetical protein